METFLIDPTSHARVALSLHSSAYAHIIVAKVVNKVKGIMAYSTLNTGFGLGGLFLGLAVLDE